MRFSSTRCSRRELNELLCAQGHGATTPTELGAHNLPDEVLVEIAAAEGRTIVTEIAQDFAAVDGCTVLLVRKQWWRPQVLPDRLAAALDRLAEENPDPAQWCHWLRERLR